MPSKVFTRSIHVTVQAAVMSAGMAGLVFFVPAVAAPPERVYSEQKIVYHMNGADLKHQQGFLNNIQNNINAVGAERVHAAVVMHGDGLTLLMNAKTDESLRAKIDNLKAQNVRFLVCNNTLVGRKLDMKTDLYDVEDADIVPSGVAEIVQLQVEGYSYIKP